MKRTLLVFLFPAVVSAQTTSVHFQLNNPDIFPVGTELSPSCGAPNDSGLAQIVTYYCTAPGISYAEEWQNGGLAYCDCDGQQLVAALLANPNVTRAQVSPEVGTLSNAIYIDGGDAYPEITGYDSQHIAVTGDSTLNGIYQNFSVYYQYDYDFMTWKDLTCDCAVSQLKDALADAGYISGENESFDYVGNAVLGVPQQVKKDVRIFPNPFRETLNIESDNPISQYLLYDNTGKQLIRENSKTAFDAKTGNLATGMYFLRLQSGNGVWATCKIVKM